FLEVSYTQMIATQCTLALKNTPNINLFTSNKNGRSMRQKTPGKIFKYKCHRCHQIDHKAIDCRDRHEKKNTKTNTRKKQLMRMSLSSFLSLRPFHIRYGIIQEAMRDVSIVDALHICIITKTKK
ncbi:hypothetical protein ALC53_07448, partial [Atta colombica]